MNEDLFYKGRDKYKQDKNKNERNSPNNKSYLIIKHEEEFDLFLRYYQLEHKVQSPGVDFQLDVYEFDKWVNLRSESTVENVNLFAQNILKVY